jgi:hypothetical protein
MNHFANQLFDNLSKGFKVSLFFCEKPSSSVMNLLNSYAFPQLQEFNARDGLQIIECKIIYVFWKLEHLVVDTSLFLRT